MPKMIIDIPSDVHAALRKDADNEKRHMKFQVIKRLEVVYKEMGLLKEEDNGNQQN